MKLYVVRHGETVFNAQNRYAGSTDVPLNDMGKEQALRLAKQLESYKFDFIITSPLIRAQETAEIINRNLNLPIIIMDAFVERNMGVYEGLTREEAQQNFPETWQRLGKLGIDDAPDAGETIRQCDQRVTNGLLELMQIKNDQTPLLVCHGFVSRLINRYFHELDYYAMHSFSLGNCEIVEYDT